MAPIAGTLAGSGALPGKLKAIGLLKFETTVGYFDRPRGDVNNPGLLLMDMRWSPSPWFEAGATRLSMFGGEGRPMPSIGQLILPTDPHVTDDPDKELPDQNELASLDFRGTLPVAKILGGPVKWVEAYWQYGAEDMIVLHLGEVPYPSLAGVANTYGLETRVGPVTMTVERSRIFDDYFRWYLGHRVYHEGFTQDGLVIGHHAGGDSMSWWAEAAWMPDQELTLVGVTGHARISLSYEEIYRVGIIESFNDNLLALAQDEQSHTLTAVGAWQGPRLGLELAYTVQIIDGEGFVPGASDVKHRVYLAASYRGSLSK